VRDGRLVAALPARFVPVRVAEGALTAAVASPPLTDQHGAATIEIVLPDGCRVRVGNEVSLATLRRVVTALRG
jgi:hypothetical protein